MKLSISNIAWEQDVDEQMYKLMQVLSYNYLEIAPTRIFPENPYNRLKEAVHWSKNIFDNYLENSTRKITIARWI